MGFIGKIKRIYLEKTGKIKEKWPIVIRVYRKGGDNYNLSKVTRGRTLREEDGTIELEVLDSPLKSSEVPYEHFTDRKDGVDELEIVRHTRENFSPLKKEIKVDDEDGSIEKIYDMEQMKKTLVSDWENKVEVTENEEGNWIKDNIQVISAFMLLIGGGIYFYLVATASGKANPVPEGSENIIPLICITGKHKLAEVSNKL